MKNRIPHYDELPDMLTPAEVTQYLRCSYETTVRMCRSGTIKSKRVGKKYLVYKKWLAEFLELDSL